MKNAPHVRSAFKQEFANPRLWWERAVVIAFAVLAGLTVVGFTWLTEQALDYFLKLRVHLTWSPLIWTPLCTAAIVWLTRRYAPGAAGSGIPQVMAALDAAVPVAERGLFVSLRLSVAKVLLTTWGLLAGLSLGREGPSVQIAAGVMHHARRWLPRGSTVSAHGLLIAGGAAGIAAAFNTPLAGVMFAIEELSRNPEQRSSGLLVAGIVLAGLVAVSINGNATYFGVIQVSDVSSSLLLPGLLVAVSAGVAGGLFARLLVASLTGSSRDRFSRLRATHPVAFAAACGAVVALIGVISQGSTFGSGYDYSRALLEGGQSTSPFDTLLKFIATWVTAWSGVPAGIFAPSLSIGAGIGHNIALLTNHPQAATLIALGMAGFLAAATQAPLTSFIIVMEMVNGHAMVLSLMACALVASAISRVLSQPLYPTLAQLQIGRLGARAVAPADDVANDDAQEDPTEPPSAPSAMVPTTAPTTPLKPPPSPPPAS